MRKKFVWILAWSALVLTLAACAPAPRPDDKTAGDDPKAHLPTHLIHTDHSSIIQGPFGSGPEVTQACLKCHPDAANQVMHTTHWTWEGQPVTVSWRSEPVTIGKKNQINNFCISAQGNQKKCTSCHTGYGWADNTFDFQNANNVDCLACHADAAIYNKGDYGLPAASVNLLAAARSVRAPTREECGKCHFDGGGGNGVKHGDLDESLYFPSENLDVHMGRLNFQCTDCHRTEEHAIRGKLLADNYTIDAKDQVACEDCHTGAIHADERLNEHIKTVACQTCHIPDMARKDPTKTYWDWSTAGQDRTEDHYTYLKIKGSFVYDENVAPTYEWFNGNVDYRYLLGDAIDPAKPTDIVRPAGDIHDANARIAPFKIHVANQPYDKVNQILIPPRTAGENGFWTTFDWPSALALGAQDAGLKFSGDYGFTETRMAYPTTHMVQPKEKALQCSDCHSDNGRLDWKALGYPGDPMKWGGRDTLKLTPAQPIAAAPSPAEAMP